MLQQYGQAGDAQPVVTRWLLTRTVPLGGGRSQLTYLIDGSVRRVCSVWGDPPDDRVVAAAGSALVVEQDERPVGKRYSLSDDPTGPA